MKQSLFLLSILAVMGLTSCDPCYNLTLCNKSGKDHSVRIIYYDGFADSYNRAGEFHGMYYKDYITICGLTDTKGRPTSKDSLSANWMNTYTFTLPAASKVVLDHGMGTAPPFQQIIIDNKDTINSDEKRVRKRPKMMVGGLYTVTLTD